LNYLAHLYLSGDDELLAVGNFCGDAIRRSQLDQYPEGMQRGVELHWLIDQFTDHHPVVERSKERIRPVYHKYASVLMDIYYDHFLALHWSKYSPVDLPAYAQSMYDLMYAHKPILPERIQFMLPYMKRYDWLTNYAHFEGINSVLQGMGRRARFESRMEEGVRELKAYHAELEADYFEFFPDLEAACRDFLA
jgi:acyl carrier protein phosphodiesterase